MSEDGKVNLTPCCLCGQPLVGIGNNAAPLAAGRCCDLCYELRVGPERLKKAVINIKAFTYKGLEEIAEAICDHYCKWMVTANDDEDLERHCKDCPVNRLVG